MLLAAILKAKMNRTYFVKCGFKRNQHAILLFVSLTLSLINLSCDPPKPDKESVANTQEIYQCIPCGYDCDKKVYDKAGECPNCKMELVKQSSIVFKTIEPSETVSYTHLTLPTN